MKKKKKSDKKGFTLIELLAIILILALVVSIVVYVVTDVVKNAKDNSYEVTVNNIVNVASEFVLENSSDKISWVDSDAQYQYTCVSVQDLIDGGYYKSDVLDSYINDTDKVSADDYIELKRNKTSKNIEVKRLLTKEEDKALCNNIDDSIIQISVFKHDECDEINGWSKCKLVNIKYQITNISKPIVDYKYGYDFLKDGVVEEFKVEDISFTKNIEYVNFIVDKNGKVEAYIDDKSNDKDVLGIDNVGPEINHQYVGAKSVNNTVTIPLVVTDVGVGVDGSSFTKDDLEITVGGKKITEGITFTKVNDNKYNLKIDNSTDTGQIVIKVAEDKVEDLLGNSNEPFNYDEISFNNKYTIEYIVNCGFSSLKNQEIKMGDNFSISAVPNCSGKTFGGWTTRSDGKDDGYNWTGLSGIWNYKNGEKGIVNNKLVLYARWSNNKVTIKYSVNGGTIKNRTSDSNGIYNWDTDSSGIIRLNKNVYTTEVDYGGTIDKNGLVNYNNSKYIDITRTGYVGVSGAEWICLSDNCKGKTYNQLLETYKSSDFCDAKTKDCTVELGVNWLNVYTINYNVNGGTGGPSAQIKIHDVDLILSSTKPTRTGYTFKGWSTSATSTTVSYQSGGIYTKNAGATLYAVWQANTYTINYNANGGSKAPAAQTKTHDEVLTLSSDVPIKEGYTFKGWSTSATSTIVSYPSGGTYTKNAGATLYAVWSINTYKVIIKYSVNGGTIKNKTYDSNGTYNWITDSSGIIKLNNSVYTTEIDYGQTIGKDGLVNYNNSKYVDITRTGYVGVSGAEWICLSDNCKGKTYNQLLETYKSSDFCDAKTNDCTVVLGVNWKEKKYTVSYNANGGSKAPAAQTKTHGVDLTLSSIVPSKDGYEFKGWGTSVSDTTVDYQPGGKYTINEDVVLYAIWNTNKYKVTIKYSVNGGIIKNKTYDSNGTYNWITDSSGIIKLNNSVYTTEIDYGQTIGKDGLVNYNNSKYVDITRTGYVGVSGAEWICLSDNCKGKTYNQLLETYKSSDFCDAKTKDCTVVLGVNWKGNTYKVDYEANIFSPLDSSRGIRSNFDGDDEDNRGDYMLHVLYDHFQSNLTFKTVTSTSRLNNLLLGLNPLSFKSGEKYEVTLTYVSGRYEKNVKDNVAMLVGQTGDASCMVDDSCWNKKVLLELPTKDDPVSKSTITVVDGNAYLKQIMSSSYPLDVKFIDYVVNVSIRKVIDGVTTQSFVCGNGERYNVPSKSNLPVKLGYESFEDTGWKLINKTSWGAEWGAPVKSGDSITNCKDHKVYAILKPKTLYFRFDGNGKDIGLSDYKASYIYDEILPNENASLDELDPWDEGDNPAKNHAKIDANAFKQWRFKIKPFANSNEELWFGCAKGTFSEDASGHEHTYQNICGGHSNPTLGWYKKEDIDVFYTRALEVGGINTSNFLGFDVVAVAQWK